MVLTAQSTAMYKQFAGSMPG